MIFPSNRVRIMVATKAIDFRKGHDGLAALVSSVLRKDPFTGTVFIFCDRAGLVNGDDGPTSRSILLSVVGTPPQDADFGGRDAPKLYLGLNRAMGKSELIPSVVPARDVTPSPKGAGSQ